MNYKKLLFVLFIVYWTIAFGVALFFKDAKVQIRDSAFRYFIPFGYNMFVPVTQTNFDVTYRFYKDGNEISEISSVDYLNPKTKHGLLKHKKLFLEKMLYFYRIPDLDFAFLESDYKHKYFHADFDLDEKIKEDLYLKKITEKLQKFPTHFLAENPEIKYVDSIYFTIRRTPTILPFETEYKNNYTFYVGDTIFFESGILATNQLDK